MDSKTLRLIDANANRAREGLRVAEEIARMLWDDREMTEKIKSMRHQVTHLVTKLPVSGDDLLKARESEADVGTATRLAGEKDRADLGSVATSNIKRAQESCRVLEEFTKMTDAEVAEGFKELRFSLYAFEKDFLLKAAGK